MHFFVSYPLGLLTVLSALLEPTFGQSYGGSQYYYTYATPSPIATTVATVAAKTTAPAPVTNSNTAPGGVPAKPILSTNGSVCDTRTAFAFIGCPCALVGKTCADPNSNCTAAAAGRKKRFAVRGRGGSPMGAAAKFGCACKTGFTYNPAQNLCVSSVSPVQTTCTVSQFCNSPPTASGYLQGPSATPGTLLLFNGNCVVEYQFDPSATTSAVLVGKTAPQLISTYFKQSAFSGPVDLTYVNFADASNSNFKLNLLSRATPSVLTCTTDLTKETMSATCPAPPTTAGTAVPLAATTSASSQIDTTDGSNLQVVQYAVIGGNEIGLYNADFTKLYSQTSGFLGDASNSVIKKISAIQILTDTQGFTGTRLIVFGQDATGKNYVGFTDNQKVITQGVATFPLSGTTNAFTPGGTFSPSTPALQTATFGGTIACT